MNAGWPRRGIAALPAAAALWIAITVATPAKASPEIRLSERNRVPACVTPDRLMAFLRQRTPNLHKRFGDIAHHYKKHGEKYRVRWDYAFFQMLLETNYLSYRTGRGSWGDVDPKQNNFAGIGATGGGVPGERFPDVSSGVLGQIQHLVAYSGERVEKPVSSRTSEVQDDVISKSKRLRRPVTFRDLTMRWAIDRRYHHSIESIADRFRAAHCTGREEQIASADAPELRSGKSRRPQVTAAASKSRTKASRGMQPAPEPDTDEVLVDEDEEAKSQSAAAPQTEPVPPSEPTQGQRIARDAATTPTQNPLRAVGGPKDGEKVALVAPPVPAPRPATCKVWTASYGGVRNVLIRSLVGGELHYTALQVLDGQENVLAASFIRNHAQGGQPIGEFESRESALLKAFDLCPQHARAGN